MLCVCACGGVRGKVLEVTKAERRLLLAVFFVGFVMVL